MKSNLTSFTRLFEQVEGVEIPLIQRDYAQGRAGEAVERIRSGFLDVLEGAITGGEPVSLDFVYGDVLHGTLRPLDGQQRLTTLFLLHWYVGARAGQQSSAGGWKRFSYATRASARRFCARLVESTPPPDVDRMSAWLTDQAWFAFGWTHDPTVQSMLVMLDAIHERLRDRDCSEVWARLVDVERPAVVFHVLPVEGMGLNEELYIKMNSRGKPLTPFETFKARFLQHLEGWCTPARVQQIALALDGAWSDVFWAYRGDDDIVDDEMMRFFHFVTELCEWREGRAELEGAERASVELRAERLFAAANPKREEHLALLVSAFEAWVGEDVGALFDGLFTKSSDGRRVVLFGVEGAVETDLFAACVRGAGEWAGKKRVFSLPETLLLYGVLLARIHSIPEPGRRLRVVRNLVEASSNEIRAEKMMDLLEDVHRVVVERTVDGLTAFNTAQAAEEQRKAALLAAKSELESSLFALEDHPVLRGCLAAFDLDADVSTFDRRANAFVRVLSDRTCWPDLTGALLAVGDYARHGKQWSYFGSGTNEAPWRTVFTAPVGRSPMARTRDVLMAFLDEVGKDAGDHKSTLGRLPPSWLASQSTFDWRFYFVKYSAIREGHSGIYVSATEPMSFDLCMLNKTRLASHYRDAFLHATWCTSGVGPAVEKRMFTGYATDPRWMRLARSGAEMRSVEQGFALKRPGADHAAAFDRVCGRYAVGEDLVLRVPRVEVEGAWRDASDRIALGAAFLREMVAEGL